jgi:hypothetical protein
MTYETFECFFIPVVGLWDQATQTILLKNPFKLEVKWIFGRIFTRQYCFYNWEDQKWHKSLTTQLPEWRLKSV